MQPKTSRNPKTSQALRFQTPPLFLLLLAGGFLAVGAGLNQAGAQDTAGAKDPAAAPAGDASGTAAKAEGEDTELAKQMEVIDEGMKQLRRSLRNPADNAKSLEMVTSIQQAAIASKALVPAKAASVPEAERAKFVTAYRKDMAALVAEMCKLEMALLDGNNEEAQNIHKALKDMEETGHEKYEEEG